MAERRANGVSRRGRKSRAEDLFDEVVAKHASKYAETPESRRAPSTTMEVEPSSLTRNKQSLRWYE